MLNLEMILDTTMFHGSEKLLQFDSFLVGKVLETGLAENK